MSDLKLRLGLVIKGKRKDKNMSQAKLAEKAGISPKYLGEVERGEGNISIDKLESISLALGCPASDLLDNTHKEGRPLLMNEIDNMLHKASNTEVENVYRVVKALLNK